MAEDVKKKKENQKENKKKCSVRALLYQFRFWEHYGVFYRSSW